MDDKVQEVVENIKEMVESGDVRPETGADVIEELKEDVVTEVTAEETAPEETKPNDHDLLEVIEKLTEEVMSLKARIQALENVKVDEKVDEPKAESECSEEDKTKARINNIYNSITMPQAVIANAPKARERVVQKVDYKTYKAFINEY